MIYLLAIVVPPVAVLMVGKPIQALLNLALWACFIVPGIIHALFVVSAAKSDQRHREMLEAMRER